MTVAGLYFRKGYLQSECKVLYGCTGSVEDAGEGIYRQLVYFLCGGSGLHFGADCDFVCCNAEILYRWAFRSRQRMICGAADEGSAALFVCGGRLSEN